MSLLPLDVAMSNKVRRRVFFYRYVDGEPTDDTDPLGLMPQWVLAGGVGAFGGALGSAAGAALAGEGMSGIAKAAAQGAVAGGIAGLTAGAKGWSIAGAALMDISINAAFITYDLLDHVGKTRGRRDKSDGANGLREKRERSRELSRVREPSFRCVRPMQ